MVTMMSAHHSTPHHENHGAKTHEHYDKWEYPPSTPHHVPRSRPVAVLRWLSCCGWLSLGDRLHMISEENRQRQKDRFSLSHIAASLTEVSSLTKV